MNRHFAVLISAFLMLCAADQADAILFSGGSSAPPPPTPGLPAPLTVYNTSGSTITNVPVSYEQPFATGDMPTGYHAVVYSGATPLTTQHDDCSSWLQDGSCKSTQLSFAAPSITGSSNAAYTVQAVSGAPSTTPNISTAQATGNTNICVKTSDLATANGTAETGTWRLACLNDIIANYSQFNSSTGYGANPTGGWEYYSKGPVKIGIHAWQFAKRESDSAIHKWLRTDLWVDMRGSGATPCPCSVSFLVSQPNQFGGVAAGTIGGTTESAYNFSATLLNGANTIRAFGGSGDSRTATVANANFNTTTKAIDLTGTWAASTAGAFPIKVTCATSCPTGLTNGNVYWITQAYGSAAGQVNIYEHQCDIGAAYTGCTSGIINFSSQGSGTITFTPLVFTNPYGGFLGLDADANRSWISAAGTATTAPAILIGHDFPYLTQKTKATPPFITALAGALRSFGTSYDYYPGTYTYPWNINTTGDGVGDERISYINHSGAYALFNPADPAAAKNARVIAAGFARIEMYNIDETVGQPMVYNNGHAKNGVTYAAMGAVQPSVRTYPYLGGSLMSPYATTYDYDSFYWSYGTRLDGSHLPAPMQTPLLKSGDPEWNFTLLQEANAVSGEGYVGSQTISGTTYYRPLGANEQTRGTAWGTRVIGQANHFIRSSNPAAPYIKDLLSDQAGWLIAAHTNYINANAKALGLFVNDVSDPANYQFQPWQNDFLYSVTGMEEWRGEYANFAAFNRYHEKFVIGRMDTLGTVGGGGCLWAGASRLMRPYSTDIGNDYANLYQTYTGLYTHQAASQDSLSGWAPGHGGMNPWVGCPSTGLIQDPGGSFIYQPSSLIAFQATSTAMASVLGVARAATMYGQIRAMEYAATPNMSFITYDNGGGSYISVPEFAWGPLGATQ